MSLGGVSMISMYSSHVAITSPLAVIGTTSGKIGFFGTVAGSAKKSVSTITATSSATASTVATKLNELINALKAYNLIG